MRAKEYCTEYEATPAAIDADLKVSVPTDSGDSHATSTAPATSGTGTSGIHLRALFRLRVPNCLKIKRQSHVASGMYRFVAGKCHQDQIRSTFYQTDQQGWLP